MARIASLLPSATEIACALGLREQLVGISHECDFPPGVEALPVLTSSRSRLSGTSGEIDRDIRRLVADALSIYQVDVPALEQAAPDLVLTQDLCEVCAVSYEDVCAAVAQLGKPGTQVVNLRPERLEDILHDVMRVAEAAGVPEQGGLVAGELREGLQDVARQSHASRGTRKPSVLTVEWLDPVMVGGLWMPELIELAGGIPLVTRPGQHAPTLTMAELQALDPAPDVVMVKPCGFDLQRTLLERETLLELFGQLDWPAVRDNAIWLADGNAYFNRPGPRILESLEILAACVHPWACHQFGDKHRDSMLRLPRD